jgi:hypothetical protein
MERIPNDPRNWLTYVPRTLERISPLYAHLYSQMREDPEVFSLLTLVDPDQPIPVLFLSAINFLLFEHPEHPFAQFYPYLTTTPRSPSEAYPFFRNFCLEHKEALQQLLPTARLQTNEVTRCANLLPAFELVSDREDRQPLAIIEIGSSAGLLLNWERHGYTYNHILTVGNEDSSVQISCELEGERFPIPMTLPPTARCLGIELTPLDINNERDVRWLRSCIWPEERKRYQLLDAAIALARQYPPRVLSGDASRLLPELLPTIPPEWPVCLFHCFALNQGPMPVKEHIIQALVDASLKRTIYRVSLEADPLKEGQLPRLELFTYRRGDLFQYEWLANCAFHGERMEWIAPLYS